MKKLSKVILLASVITPLFVAVIIFLESISIFLVGFLNNFLFLVIVPTIIQTIVAIISLYSLVSFKEKNLDRNTIFVFSISLFLSGLFIIIVLTFLILLTRSVI